MSTVIPSIPGENASTGISEPQRILNIFFAPRKTFEDIRRNPSWWVPWLLVSICILGASFVVKQKVNLEQVVRHQMAQSQASENLSKEQREQQERRIAIVVKIIRVGSYIYPLIFLITGLVIGAILMGTFNFILEAEVPLNHSLAIVFYSWLPSIIAEALGIITLLLSTHLEGVNLRNMIATNPGYFMDPSSSSKFLYGMASSLDLIAIWTIILLGIGFKVNSANRKLTMGMSIGTVASVYLVYRVIVSALGGVKLAG
jgi:hypothetical protein